MPIQQCTRLVAYVLIAIFSLPLSAWGLRLDITAHPGHEAASKERCIRNYVAKDQLVVVTANVEGRQGDGQILNMHIRDAAGNDYQQPRDVVGENRWAFTAHTDSVFDVCLENIWIGPYHGTPPSRPVELNIDIGADAKDWSAIQASEKLKPIEGELKRMEEIVNEVVAQLEYLQAREKNLRDTNESTNDRVKWFGVVRMMTLAMLCGGQLAYLRAYFRSKHLI